LHSLHNVAKIFPKLKWSLFNKWNEKYIMSPWSQQLKPQISLVWIHCLATKCQEP
jgi:hypothetical protein